MRLRSRHRLAKASILSDLKHSYELRVGGLLGCEKNGRLAGLTTTLASEINAVEQRKKRPADAQVKFEYAIHTLLKDCWLGIHISPAYECGIHKRSNWYSETPKYRDPNLTYKQTMAANTIL